MRYFPLFLDLTGKPVLLVGGGAVAARKFGLLAEAHAVITVVAPSLGAELAAALARQEFTHHAREFAATDIDKETREELGLRQDIQQRDEFLGLVSHELRTPLTVIRGNALLLSRRGDHANPEALAEGLQDIEASSRQLQRLLENMLVLSRLSTFDPGTEIEPQIVAALVSGAVSEFQERHPGVRVELEIEDGLPIVAANATFVDQVMWNLCRNAFRHCRRQQASIRIVVALEGEGNTVKLDVVDDGPGVPPELRSQLFEPFCTASPGGSGLGLYIAREVCEANGATLEYVETAGGAQFTVNCRTGEEVGRLA